MNHSSNFKREEALSFFNELLAGFPVDALLAEPQQVGGTLAKTAVTLAQEFNKSIEISQVQKAPTQPVFTGDAYGYFRNKGNRLYYGSGEDWWIVTEAETQEWAFQLAEQMNRMIGVSL